MAVEAEIKTYLKTLNPCVKAYMERHYGPVLTDVIGFASVYSYLPGPQNVASGGPKGAWSEFGKDVGAKGMIDILLHRWVPKVAAGVDRVACVVSIIGTIGANAANIVAAEKANLNCGCKRE